MVNGPSAARTVIGTAIAPATTMTVASITAALCRRRLARGPFVFSVTFGLPLSPGNGRPAMDVERP
jgi:hypothetical protein